MHSLTGGLEHAGQVNETRFAGGVGIGCQKEHA
jgi:hypothetical protein